MQQTKTLYEMWLWPEPNYTAMAASDASPHVPTLRWWRTAASSLIDAAALPSTAVDADPELISLRQSPLETFAVALEKALTSGPVCLSLAAGLPQFWFEFPWERLRLRGSTLTGRLVVVRRRLLTAEPPIFPEVGRVMVLDLWPPREIEQPFCNLANPATSIFVNRGAAARYAAQSSRDLNGLSALVVIAHGGEKPEAPFLDEQGRPWALPAGCSLPPLIVLLACGNRDGNLLEYASSLLEAGARTVLAPLGKLSAPSAAKALHGLLNAWQAGRPVAEALAAIAMADDSGHGARRLCLVGDPMLRVAACPTPWELPRQSLIQAVRAVLAVETVEKPDNPGDNGTLAALLERITLEAFQEDGERVWDGVQPAKGVRKRLREALALRLDGDQTQAKVLLHTLWQIQKDLSPLTRAWIVPLMHHLAESHNHTLLPGIEALRHAHDGNLPDGAAQRHGWAIGFYREGRYAQALHELGEGVSFLTITPDIEAAESLGLLVNCLIDLDLPDLIVGPMEQLTQATRGSSMEAAAQRFRLLDRRARLALRKGQPRAALVHFQRKRTEAPNHGEDGRRELAWLLYVAAWHEPLGEATTKLANEVLALLSDPAATTTAREQEKGNSNFSYLLRALGVYTWRTATAAGESDVGASTAACLVAHFSLLRQRLVVGDPGPFAMTLGYLLLYARTRSSAALGFNDAFLTSVWEEVRAALKDREYLLELAALQYLFKEDASTSLDDFQQMRAQAVAKLANFPSWVWKGMSLPLDFSATVERRANEERVLLWNIGPFAMTDNERVMKLVQQGLLPL